MRSYARQGAVTPTAAIPLPPTAPREFTLPARGMFEEPLPRLRAPQLAGPAAGAMRAAESAFFGAPDMAQEEFKKKYAEYVAASLRAQEATTRVADAMKFLTQTGNETVNTIFAVAGALASILAQTGGGVGEFFKGLGFQEGGTVPGPIGKPQLAVVHGGERVIPARESAGNLYTSVTFNVSAMDAQSVAEFFDRYGGHVARQVVKAADQSQAFRRRLM